LRFKRILIMSYIRPTLVLLALIPLLIANSCKTRQQRAQEKMDKAIQASIDSVVNLPEIEFSDFLGITKESTVYNPSATRKNDILHTKLDVRFNIPDEQLFGEAEIRVKPYFYPVDSLILDAKAFDIERIALKNKRGELKDLKYTYSDDFLRIALDTTYTKSQEYTVFIKYVANPKNVKAQGSAAITDARGLYFIDPRETDPDKPTQIWTQGETESSSCWFPTIDKPNEKMTHEISITVPDKYVTLSNGLKTDSKKSANGERTDTWKMDLPNAPYLVMMAIGEFAIVNDTWRKIPVDYYVEPEFAPYAKKIFGKTPEMIEFFSQKMGVDYPWPKYSQIVVRDYVSGAMENTSATLFGEFVQQTPAEMIDRDFEDIIAHELFHHWFGDLVTCESWSNLPLNESFASYGEYLWYEYKYGRDAADYHLQKDLSTYIEESYSKKVNLIRFDYEKREDMFDRHSYQKGACVLHMLRNAVGDDAFFASLKLYLSNNAYKPAEIHNLRLAFEEVTGEDLNWFFNQWFLDKGHPLLSVSWEHDASTQKIQLILEQTQNTEASPVYRLPLKIAIGKGDQTRLESITMYHQVDTFYFEGAESPDYLLVDSEHQLLGQVNQQMTVTQARELYLHGKTYRNRFAALDVLLENSETPGVSEILKLALKDSFWNIRMYALSGMDPVIAQDPENYKNILMHLASNDEKSQVRAEAISKLGFAGNEPAVFRVFEKAIQDSSVLVQGAGIAAMYAANPEKTRMVLEPLEKTASGDLLTSIAAIYATSGTPDKLDFLKKAYAGVKDPNDRYVFVQIIGKYAISQGDPIMYQSIPYFTDVAKRSSVWWMRLSGIQVLAELQTQYDSQVDQINEEIMAMKEKGTGVSVVQDKEIEKTAIKSKSREISIIIDTIREEEKDPNLVRMLNMFR
jgi:aminopeptidase N